MAGFPNVDSLPSVWSPGLLSWLNRLRNVVNGLMRGQANNTGTVTLTASSATTTLTNENIGGGTVVLLQPQTAHASAEIGNGTIYFGTPTAGSVVINHANSAQTDRVFAYALHG